VSAAHSYNLAHHVEQKRARQGIRANRSDCRSHCLVVAEVPTTKTNFSQIARRMSGLISASCRDE